MTPAPTPLRRSLAALSALCVLLAPVTQLAHARAMAHDVSQRPAASSMRHQMPPMSAPHGSHHQHGATCCDLCPAGCQTVAVTPAMATLSGIIVVHAFGPATARRNAGSRRAQHVLPFSLAPPAASV